MSDLIRCLTGEVSLIIQAARQPGSQVNRLSGSQATRQPGFQAARQIEIEERKGGFVHGE